MDVELLKDEGNYNIDRLRTIVLVEGDHNQNGKHLGKNAMRMATDSQCTSANAPEQYGSKKYHRAIEVVLNSRLIDDILRQRRQPGVICLNDAVSCYDRIVHSVFSMCLARIGSRDTAVQSSIETLQSLCHHVRTAFGDSDASYTGTSEKPLQGLVQGYGPAPAGWALISPPIINMMREFGFGFGSDPQIII